MANIKIKVKTDGGIDLDVCVVDLSQGDATPPPQDYFRLVHGVPSGDIQIAPDQNEQGQYHIHWYAKDPTGVRPPKDDYTYVLNRETVSVVAGTAAMTFVAAPAEVTIKNIDQITIYVTLYDLSEGPDAPPVARLSLAPGAVSEAVDIEPDEKESGRCHIHWVAQDPDRTRPDKPGWRYVAGTVEVQVKAGP